MRRQEILNLWSCAVLLSLATACGGDMAEHVDARPLVLTTSIGTQSRAAASSDLQSVQLASGNKVGVFVVRYSTDEAWLSNGEFTADGNGNLHGSPLFFPFDELAVNIYAYAPRQADAALTSCGFAIQTDQTTEESYIQSDLLIGRPASNPVSARQSNVPLVFTHKMAKIVIDFNSSGATGLEDVQMTTCPLYTQVTIDIKNNKVSIDDTVTPASLTTQINADSKAVILLPAQTVDADVRLFSMTQSGTPLHYVTVAPVTFDAGKVYTYTMKIETSQKEMVPSSCSVTPWGTGNASSGHIVVNQ